MSALVELSWDVAAVDGGARRPSLADIGGALLEDKGGSAPPKTGTHLYADMGNQWEKQLAAIGRVVSPVIITIDFSAGVPFIDKIQCASAVMVAGDFAVSDDGTGVTRLQWTSTKFPTPTCDPEGPSINSTTGSPALGVVELKLNWAGSGAGASTPGTHRIIVTTWTAATDVAPAVLANIRCTIRLN